MALFRYFAFSHIMLLLLVTDGESGSFRGLGSSLILLLFLFFESQIEDWLFFRTWICVSVSAPPVHSPAHFVAVMWKP